MAKLTFRGITVEAAEITPQVKRELAFLILSSGKVSDEILPKPPDISEQEIAALVDEIDQVASEQLDLADLGRQVAAELAYLNSTIAGWAALTPEQKDAAQKRSLQEIRAILKALRFVVRQGQ